MGSVRRARKAPGDDDASGFDGLYGAISRDRTRDGGVLPPTSRTPPGGI